MTSEVPEFEIRLMKREEIPQVLDLWRETNLSEGTYSIDTWYEYDPEGFYAAVTKDGTVIGSCSGVLQHNDLIFFGLYAVRSTLQRRGIGIKIWGKVMERLGDRNAGVNPVPEQLANYRDRSGFRIQSDWCCVVCKTKELSTSGMLTELPGIDINVIRPEKTYDASEYDAISEYDADVLGFCRPRLAELQCKQKESITIVARNAHDNSVCGYGNVKENIKGNALVGPLFADSDSIAELILYHIVKSFPTAESKGITLMTVDCNKDALALFEKLGFKIEEGTARLYKNEEVEVQFNKVFGQHNLNFSVF